MKEGFPLLRGGFREPPTSTSWRQRFRSRATESTLLSSGFEAVVVALYAHPLLVRDLRKSIQSQIKLATEFVRTHPDWTLARSSSDVAQAKASGKRTLILSLEGAEGVVESAEDAAWLWEEGVRIVAPFHLTDDRLGGCALLRFPGNLASRGTYAALLCPCFDAQGYRVNPRGITPHGVRIVETLLQQKMWIDLSHIGDRSYETVNAMLGNLPHLWSHTVLRSHHKAERGLSLSALERVRETQGVVGLMPSESMLCGALNSFASQQREMAEQVGADAVGLGSDLNAPIAGIRPDVRGALGGRGFHRQDQAGSLIEASRALGATFSSDLGLSRFLQAWARVNP